MNTTDQKIAEVLAKFGEPMAGNVWRVQGNAVIYHKALERIAQQAKIQFDAPTLVRAERDECVILVTGRMGERAEWSLGEALLGVNYRVSGKQAAYVYAMAEKRAKDRVILKLIELHGLIYSEEEADDFKNSRPTQGDDQVEVENKSPAEQKVDRTIKQVVSELEADLKQKITKAKSINAVTDLMLHADTQKVLNDLPDGIRDGIRDHAKHRLVELGWPTNKEAAAKKVDHAETKKSEPQPDPAQVMIDKLEAIRTDMATAKKARSGRENLIAAAKEKLVAWSKENAAPIGHLGDDDRARVKAVYETAKDELIQLMG